MSLNHFGGRQGLVATVDGLDHTGSQVLEGHSAHVVHAHHGLTVVTALSDAGDYRNLAQQFHAQRLGQLFAAVMSKDVIFLVGMGGRREP